MPKKEKKAWTVQIVSDGKNVKFIYDKNVNRYELIGLMEVELNILKKELIENMIKK